MEQSTSIHQAIQRVVAELANYAEPMYEYLGGLKTKIAESTPDVMKEDDLKYLKHILIHLKRFEQLTEMFSIDSRKLEILQEIQELERDIRPKEQKIRFKSNTLTFQFETAVHRNAMDAYVFAVEKDLDAFVAGNLYLTMHPSTANTILNAGFSMEKLFCHKKPDGDYELRRIPLGKDDTKFTCEIVNE